MTTVEIDQNIDHLIDEINDLVPKFSVLNDKPCKHCGKPHRWITVNCGTPLYWFEGEKPVMEGPYVVPPENAIYAGDWFRRHENS